MAGSSFHFVKRDYDSQEFTTSGSFVVPASVNLVFVEMYGGGGSGAVGLFANEDAEGGKAGAYIFTALSVNPGESLSVVCGGGGAPQSTPINDGNDGAQSSVAGALGTVRAHGGRGGSRCDRNDDTLLSKLMEPKSGVYGNPGVTNLNANGDGYGGDGAKGNGGDGGVAGVTSGGLGAGGGGIVKGAPDPGSSGAGGAGYCKIYYKQNP